MKDYSKDIRQLKILNLILIFIIVAFTFYSFSDKNKRTFKEIDVQRINVVEEDGTLKLAIFNSASLQRGKAVRQSEGSIAGLLFYNQEGTECGGLVYNGKRINGGQDAGAGLMFDGYKQDQTIALQHNEHKDSANFEINDGLTINYRPDHTLANEEYAFYKYLTQAKLPDEIKDSLRVLQARLGKIRTKRLYLGTKRGIAENAYYDNSGLFINNKLGKPAISIYVDEKNVAHLEVFDSLGKKKIKTLF